jgi:hypothetical protein
LWKRFEGAQLQLRRRKAFVFHPEEAFSPTRDLLLDFSAACSATAPPRDP